MKNKKVDEYLDKYSGHLKEILKEVRKTIHSSIPESEETISYGMPAYKLNGEILVYFAGYKNHIGFYATPSGHKKFEKELSKYKGGKGSVQFPLNEEIPFDLIQKIVTFRKIETQKSKH